MLIKETGWQEIRGAEGIRDCWRNTRRLWDSSFLCLQLSAISASWILITILPRTLHNGLDFIFLLFSWWRNLHVSSHVKCKIVVILVSYGRQWWGLIWSYCCKSGHTNEQKKIIVSCSRNKELDLCGKSKRAFPFEHNKIIFCKWNQLFALSTYR